MKVLGWLLLLGLAMLVVLLISFALKGHNSRQMQPPGLVDDRLLPCSTKPNCVCSENGTDGTHQVDPLTGISDQQWQQLPAWLAQRGARSVVVKPDYLAFEYQSRWFGFVDDLELRREGDLVHIRSASRVGYSDLGVNAKRVIELRQALQQWPP